MPEGTCIVHIEDEFHQMKPFVSRMRDYVDEYWSSQGGEVVRSTLEIIAKSEEDAADEWIVYEIGCPLGTRRAFRYVLVGSVTVPDEVVPHLLDKRHFIVDVLRPFAGAQKLWVTGDESLKSARQLGGSDESITVYTACQGGDFDALQKANQNVTFIEKARVNDLKRLISRIVGEAMLDA